MIFETCRACGCLKHAVTVWNIVSLLSCYFLCCACCFTSCDRGLSSVGLKAACVDNESVPGLNDEERLIN